MSRSTIPSHWTPVQEAYYSTIHDYVDGRTGKRGASALGPKLGKSGRTVSNEANPDMPSHKPGLEDSISVQLHAQDYRTLHAYAAELHHLAIPLPDFQVVSDMELLSAWSQWQADMGKTCEEMNAAINPDGPAGTRITDSEVRAVRARFYKHMASGLQLLHRFQELEEGDHG